MTSNQLKEEILFREIWLYDLAKVNTLDSCRMRGVLRLEIDSMKRSLDRHAKLAIIPPASESIVDL